MDRAGSTGRPGATRRRFLRVVGATASLVGVAGCEGSGGVTPPTAAPSSTAHQSPTDTRTTGTDVTPTTSATNETPPDESDTPTDTPSAAGATETAVRGAMYFPSRTFNHYQAWEMYDPRETVRNLSLARELRLDSLRVLLSYEFWRDNRTACRRHLDHFFDAAADRDVRILPVLFESIGEEPTPRNVHDRDILKNGALRSPSHAVIRDALRWGGPRRFVRWFVGRYGGHDGVLAVEIMNEPGRWAPRVEFCRAMLRAARAADPTAPLTMGCKSLPYNRQYADPELDVFQFHYNLPPTAQHMRNALREADRVSERRGKPVWLTEWQRTREEPPDRMVPNYSSLASVIRESDVDGDFFWQLMLKPAYGYVQRTKGRLNGVFYEDGSVYSATDARAIAGEGVYWREREGWPEWARELRTVPERDDDTY